MRLPLKHLSNAELLRLLRAAEISLGGFQRATAQHGSLIQSWVRGAPVLALEHYPPPTGVVDSTSGSQFFYHCHRPGAREHGHVHAFWHATRTGRRRYLRAASHNHGEWAHSSPSHLVSIGLDARGLPVSVFTVNHWVAGGHWFDAETTLSMLSRFRPSGGAEHADSAAWITAFLQMYQPLVAHALRARDTRLAARPLRSAALEDRRTEVWSSVKLDWMGDLQRLDLELARRGLVP